MPKPSRSQVGDVGAGARVVQGDNNTWIEGFTADQVRALIEAATRGSDEKFAAVSERLGLTHGGLRAVLATLGEADVPDERLPEKFGEITARLLDATTKIAALRPDNAVAREHVARASEAVASGDREEARDQLRAARAAALGAADQARLLASEAATAAASQMLQAAQAAAAEAELVLSGLDYPEAAGLFGEAAALVPTTEPEEKVDLLRRQADALQQQGKERGDNAALQQATSIYKDALENLSRRDTPLDWAATHNNLGNALNALGEREAGTARLEEAVVAYRAALEERTRERVPLDWAMTQNNLGAVLRTLGQRESGTARLEEAVAAYRAALEELARDRVPLQWATTQSNLGNALSTLGEREPGTTRLAEAVAAYRAALEERTRDGVPLQWATTQNNLGTALSTLGAREPGTARLAEAVAAFDECLDAIAAVWPPAWVDDVRANRDEAQVEVVRRTGRMAFEIDKI